MGERDLERGWAYHKNYPRAIKWHHALEEPAVRLTRWWLSKRDREGLGSIQLLRFLEWAELQFMVRSHLRSAGSASTSSSSSSAPSAATQQAAPLASVVPDCCICLAATAKVVFVPCGHLCVCCDCAEAYILRGGENCPLCRSMFEQYHKAIF